MRRLFLLIFISLLCFSAPLFASEHVIDLDKKGWEYRWGDSPFVDGVPLWSLDEDSAKWEEIDFPSNPEARDGQTNIWYRLKLPNSLPADPCLYIYSIDLITEVYFDSKMIYNFGEFDEYGKGEFIGWPWHLISLPSDASGKYIYFRVYSNYPDIGLWGEVSIGSKGDILEEFIKNDILFVISGTVAVFIGLVLIFGFIAKVRKVEFISLGLLFLTQGINLLLNAKILQLFFDYPLLHQYLYALTYFFLPVGVAAFMDSVVGRGYLGIIRRVWQIHLVYLVGSLSGAALGLYFLSHTYIYYDYLFYIFSWPLLTLSAILYFKQAGFEAKLAIVGFMVLSLFWFYSTLISWGAVPWEQVPNYLPVGLSLGFFGYVILRKLLRADDLAEANIALEMALSELGATKSKLINLNRNLESRVREEVSTRREQEHILMQKSKMATMGEMLGAIAHQLTQPLSVLLLNIDNIKDELKSGVNPERVNTILDKLVVQVWHMSDTIRHFSSFLKPSVNIEIFDTKDAVCDVKKLIDIQLKKHGIRLNIQDSGFKTKGYTNEIKHVVLNIINNARDVLEERGVLDKQIDVEFDTDISRGMGTIKIRDNAGGIPEELLPDKLFRAYVSTKGEKGTGIGLQLSKSIVETRMNGKIYAQNSKEGAEFIIELPLANL